MRLHRLRLRAFGPFAEEQIVDFDELGADGLFLLHGQTGAGKTTILDGVAFALFGRVPGARDTNRRLHSDHARAEDVPEVEIEATIGGRRLRIVRSPEHERPKKRGTGTRKVNACATLVWVDESGPDLTRLPEIGEVVTRLLGMSAEQFFQVVLLPQGEFARFLRATSEEREGLLERLFETERFGGVEDWLRERSRLLSTALDEKSGALDRLAGQIAGVCAEGPPAEPDFDWAEGRLIEARDEASSTTAELSVLADELERARAAYADAARIAELRQRGAAATARVDRLDEAQADLDLATTALAAARRAAPIVPIADDLARLHTSVAAAEAALETATGQLAELADAAELCSSRDDVDAHLDAEIDRWTGESARWEPLANRVAQRPRMVADIAQLDTEVAADQRRTVELTTSLDAAPARREIAAAALLAARDARSSVGGLRERHDRLTEVGKAFTDRIRLLDEIDAAERKALRAREVHADARDHHLDLRERRLAGMAAELAAGLVDGESCVVCGSADHPRPASSEAPLVGEADEAAAAASENRAADHRRKAEATLATLTERRAHLDQVIGETTAPELADEIQRIAQELAVAEELAGALSRHEKAVAAIDAEVDEWRAEHGRLAAAASARAERRAGLVEALATLDAEVAEATGGRVGVAERRAELAELIRRARALRAARQTVVEQTRRRDDAAERLDKLCAEAEFDGVAALRRAAAPQAQITAWEHQLQQADNVRAAAREITEAEDVRAAMAAEPVDVEACAAVAAEATERHSGAQRRHAVAVDRLRKLEEYVAQFWAALESIAPLRARHATVAGLADLVTGRGQNARRMSLHSYVLAARLEEVLVAASIRLRQMSSGRYEFVHSDAVGPRGRRGGLGIEVRDEYTGAVRAATTLSGGETFYASLALALGLADVVSAESGGRVLDTIFIDEGFGTLDPEALDEVMGVLDELREGGRVVGVVSHVGELRARIPGQLEVVRAENGSTIRARAVTSVG